jgi:hypothetical protein
MVQSVSEGAPPIRLIVNALTVDPAGMAMTFQIRLDGADEVLIGVVAIGNEQLHRQGPPPAVVFIVFHETGKDSSASR